MRIQGAKTKKICIRGLALFFALACALMLFACGIASENNNDSNINDTEDDHSHPAPELRDTLILPFATRDTLNPYRAVTELNLELASLMYEGLFAADTAYDPTPILAERIAQQSPTQFTVELRSRVFHNGNAVTVSDVIYSWRAARTNANFSARLENISSMREHDGNLEITLHRPNVFIAANLDFPVVPDGTSGQNRAPAGTGPFRFIEQDNRYMLQHCEHHPGEAPSLISIVLHGVNNSAALLHGLELGNYQFAFYNLGSGELPRVSAATYRVSTTNLVFLGINSARSQLHDASLRTALAACLDIPRLISDAFQGYAEATTTPFPQGFHALEEAFEQSFNAVAARQSLEPFGNLNFDLVVQRDNPAHLSTANLIRAQLQHFQVDVNIRALSRANYDDAIRNGNFDLYIGELRLTPSLELSPLLLYGGAATRGVQVWGRASSAYGQMLQGLLSPDDFVEIFLDDMPFVPLAYRFGMAAAVRSLRIPADELTRNNLFGNIANWQF